MKLFTCPQCEQIVFFENMQCLRCGHLLAFLPDLGVVSALEPAESPGPGYPATLFRAVDTVAAGYRYRLCAHRVQHATCNWAIPAHESDAFCAACRLNEIIPDLSNPRFKAAWAELEEAKRRLLYSFMNLGLSVEPRGQHTAQGLAFAFLKQEPGGEPVMTGHKAGLITINIDEADAVIRTQTERALGESYRTVLGHFRHESGHYFWDRLIRDTGWLEPFRALFGNERIDYAEALKRHYRGGVSPDWSGEYISTYAGSHPWEDWAETWAHFLHMVDTMETARSYGLSLAPEPATGPRPTTLTVRNFSEQHFDELIEAWLPVTMALNSFNRGMGLDDLYPFTLSSRVIEKLRFIYDLVKTPR